MLLMNKRNQNIIIFIKLSKAKLNGKKNYTKRKEKNLINIKVGS